MPQRYVLHPRLEIPAEHPMSPLIVSAEIGLRLWGIADDPF